VKTFTVRSSERGQDYSSPGLYNFKMSWNQTWNSQEAAENQRLKELSGKGSTWQTAPMFPALMSGKPRCWWNCWVTVHAKPESMNGVSTSKGAGDPETKTQLRYSESLGLCSAILFWEPSVIIGFERNHNQALEDEESIW